ncbi:MAG: HlyC/CorC family transporter [Deltaproteobacteria bacterium]|nr:HlyC/CorC family transporter [Deltaproteobacteria bacterium]
MSEPSLTLDILGIVACIVSSAFFSSSETAVTAISERRARQLVESGEKRFQSLKLWIDEPNRVLTTLLIGNTVVNTLTAALVTGITTHFSQGRTVAIATFVSSFLLLTFGEISPKTFAKHNAESFAPRALRVVRVLVWVLFPVVWLLTYLSRMIVMATGHPVSRSGPFVTEEDIAYLIDLGHEEGVLHRDERQMLASVFEFGDTVVREIMVPRTEMVAVRQDASFEELMELVASSGLSRIPVYAETIDNVVGILHTKDLIKHKADDPEPLDVARLMRKAFFAPELMPIANLLKEFQRRKTHMAIVVDEFGGTSGIVTLENVIEEIVGEIQDEHDEEEAQFRVLPDGHVLADGRLSIYDLGEKLGTEFPETGSYETLGGFLIAQAGRLPTSGTQVRWDGFEFHVREADERRVKRVEIVRIPSGEESAPTTNGKETKAAT